MSNCWLVLGPRESHAFPVAVAEYYYKSLLGPSDGVHVVGHHSYEPSRRYWACSRRPGFEQVSKQDAPRRVSGWEPQTMWLPEIRPFVLIFHDRADPILDVLAQRYQDRGQLYGVIYPTGVMVPGPACPYKMPGLERPTGDPAKFEAVYLPVTGENGGTVAGSWAPHMLRAAPAIQSYAQQYSQMGGPSGSTLILSRPGADGWTGGFIFGVPIDARRDPFNDMLAGLQSWYLSRVALLGGPLRSIHERLDVRSTLLLDPPG